MPGLRFKHFLYSSIALLALTLLGCDNGSAKKSDSSTSSSSSSSSSSTSSSGLVLTNVQVHFPPAVGVTDSDSITVRGSVTDTTDVTQVLVNGVAVTSTDGLSNWQLEVALADGPNTLAVTYTDTSGAEVPVSTISLTKDIPLVSPRKLVMDNTNNRLLVLDYSQKALISVSPDDGSRAIFSPVTGSESLFNNPGLLALDSLNSSALVAQNSDSRFVTVDAVDGTQSLAEELDIEGTTLTGSLRNMTFSGNGTYILAETETVYLNDDGERVSEDTDDATEGALPVLYSYNPSTGVKQLLTSFDYPDTTRPLQTILDLTTNPDSDYVYVLDSYVSTYTSAIIYRLIQVDKTTGVRTMLIPALDDDGDVVDDTYVFTSANHIKLDPSNSTMWAMDSGELVNIDLASFVGTVISGDETPEDAGFPLSYTSDLELDTAGTTVYTLSDSLDQVLSIDTATGLRTQLSKHPLTDATELTGFYNTPTSLTLDSGNGLVYVADGVGGHVTQVNLLTGAKTSHAQRIDEDEDGAYDTSTIFPVKVVNGDATHLYVLDNYNQYPGLSSYSRYYPRLYAINPETDEITDLLAFNNAYLNLRDMVYVPEHQALYTAESNSISSYSEFIRKIDLSGDTAKSSLLSGGSTPDLKNLFRNIRSLVWDGANQRFLVADSGINAIVAVDSSTGARTTFSGTGIPADSTFDLKTPVDMVIDEKNNRLLVVDSAAKSLLAVDLTSGARSVLLTSDYFASVREIALYSELNYLLAVSDTYDTVQAFDLTTFESVSVAR